MSGKVGRPTKRTPETVAALLDGLRKGYPKGTAAAVAGIGVSTLNEWEHAFPELAADVKEAEQQGKAKLVDKVREADSWQSAAWLLERRFPDEFAHRSKVEMKVDVQSEVKRVAEELGLDEDAVMAEAEQVLGLRR